MAGDWQALKGMTGVFVKCHYGVDAGITLDGAGCKACMYVYLFMGLAFLAYFTHFAICLSLSSLLHRAICVRSLGESGLEDSGEKGRGSE